ncbi:glycosyltransferase family 2 protein [Marilutibacter alkalisoli]|uniref:Glycosyltransferase n=1 Tax=Marilutibacter alkalisoli TaxID=2591633 RepID=A0A514BNI3_9GAMM|nr:glycosyltransferase [Lysobacter alkalisoli]QDH68947.1 glycosyltransferase [Lysobacter alkalisoli]
MSSPKLSIIVISYNMARELPRTIRSLALPFQRDIGEEDYEIIIVDNGSTQPFDHEQLRQLGANISTHTVPDASPSPVEAINRGLALARGELVGVMIDGARMASPRLLATALEAARLHPRPVIGTLAFHLGPDVQRRSMLSGYCQEVEDQLLASVDWVTDGYRLFSISVFAASSADGWFSVPAETSALFLTREHWERLGGYEPGFVAPGGGLVNLDTWARACADPTGQVILLLGEATFHQVHGGIVTNSSESKWKTFHEEYVRIRGHAYVKPQATPLLLGRLPAAALPSMQRSVERQMQPGTGKAQ